MTKSIGYKIGPTWHEHVELMARVEALEDQDIKSQTIDDETKQDPHAWGRQLAVLFEEHVHLKKELAERKVLAEDKDV